MKTKTSNSAQFWIVAAGTGGHIFPGLEIAKQIQSILHLNNNDFIFFGTPDRLEAKIIPEAGYNIEKISAKAWKGNGVMVRLSSLFFIFKAFIQIFKVFQKCGRPRAMISVGGYVSVPVALFCFLARIPFFLHEPNIKTGVANRLLSYMAELAFSVPLSDALNVMKCEVLDYGNPVREEFKRVRIRKEAKTILVLGGSQGAKALCDCSLMLMKEWLSLDKELHLYLQSGQNNYEFSVMKQQELFLQDNSTIFPFVTDPMAYLEKADLVIARAGAMTLAELSIVGLPTILVPFPFAADDHQRVNARLLEDKGAVRVAEEKSAQFLKILSTHVRDLLLGGDGLRKRIQLSETFVSFSRPHAGHKIAQAIVERTAK
jgi:UDP-N-acetylglucosamine--N-acetylmuramyl-(pentapeptide) pyrophosphoryl-undecaprenol N-acetylglucosamine transferase